ncbi:hypothetical protein AK812_SmicGene25001 [Symbiodinium microadriaticum]|uniref:Uncharacterized protein n=1 Tax=Symbiodinium microadriaticum TaxID=2951 RepID=A0A1Q9DD76_SYMMI|nr:hypothetical protein AK812_SmicGene25001 [Symbiodinium microadriaticum]CAE7409364.1 unnamed protein product [Symbiodinium microadriaticum]
MLFQTANGPLTDSAVPKMYCEAVPKMPDCFELQSSMPAFDPVGSRKTLLAPTVKVICAYGHVHDQNCDVRDENGLCIEILSGGGGGCCGAEVNQAGFSVVHLDDSGGVASVDVESPKVLVPLHSCIW